MAASPTDDTCSSDALHRKLRFYVSGSNGTECTLTGSPVVDALLVGGSVAVASAAKRAPASCHLVPARDEDLGACRTALHVPRPVPQAACDGVNVLPGSA